MVAPIMLAGELSTKRAVLRRFVAHRPTWWLGSGLVTALIGRGIVGGVGAADAIPAMLVLALVGPAEWLIHRGLFHAPPESRRSRRLRTGERHRRHHDDPAELEWLLLDGRGVVLLMLATTFPAAALSLVASTIVGTTGGAEGTVGLVLSGLILAWSALTHYEWTHLLIHSRYRPRTGRYRRLARNHLAHHHRDETTWLGVTTNLGDRLFRTVAG